MMTDGEEDHETSFGRHKSSIVANITCCFNGATHRRRASLDGASPMSVPHHWRSSTSSWFKSKTNDLPENKGRCRNFFGSRQGRRRHSSADFSYDPLSYSLNFDEDSPSSTNDAVMGFNARLPVTPPRRKSKTTMALAFHDHHLPRSPKLSDAMDSSASARPKVANDDLRKGFEALSVSMNRNNNNNNNNKTEQEDVTSPATKMTSSSNQEILVQIC